MSNTANTVQSLNGFFKEIYANKLENLIPEGYQAYNMISFNKDEKMPGNQYHQCVNLGLEHGVTYGGKNGEAFNLNTAIAGSTKDAVVQGYELVLRSILSIAAASRSVKGGAQAFERATKHLVANMVRSITRRLETQIFYGNSTYGIGVLAGAAVGNVIEISAAHWAAGIWSGAENMEIEIYTAAGVLRGAARIAGVDFDNKKLTLDLAPAGLAATDVIFYKGAKGNEFAGFDNIIRNTSTLFGIDAASFNLWKGNVVLASIFDDQVISMNKIEYCVSKAVEKGLADQDVDVFINATQWPVLLSELVSKRMFDSSYSSEKAKAGHKVIEFYGQNGTIRIHPSIYVKEGDAFVLPIDEFIRIGSSEVTFEQPGFEGKFFRLLENANGYELRAYTDQALFCTAPGKCVLLTGLDSAGGSL